MKYAHITAQPNTLYYGDCLDVMKRFPKNYVDLICLDPPFNSNEKYSSIFKGSGMNIEPQVKAFDDTWTWNDTAKERVEHVKSASLNPAHKVIAAFESIKPRSKILAYTSYMAERLFQMHRILKPTGSLYLHCDPYASHYLKLILDAIFDEKNFRNEIVWHYRRWTAASKRFQKMHDILFYYTKTDNYTFTKPLQAYADEKYIENTVRGVVDGKLVRLKDEEGNYITRNKQKGGVLMHDVWHDINFIPPGAKERMGYRTQKPIALYERIIKASSNEGDLVLDPFCGCGTTIDAALKNRRHAIGIDILPFALRLINERRLGVELPVEGIPVDVETADQLAKMPKGAERFQDWAISLVDGFASNPQKTSDEGIDGFGMFEHKPSNMDTRGIIIQVTAARGAQKHKFDKLQSDVQTHNAAMGVLITTDPQPSSRWHVNLPDIEMGQTHYKPMQCFSIAEYYQNGKRYAPPLNLPPLTNPWTGKPMQQTLFDSK